MHARHTLAIATTLASAGHIFQRSDVSAVGDAAHGYWLANRFRCDAWNQRISQHRSAIERCGTSRRTRLWIDILPTLEEILTSEPLSRVIAYLASLLEKRQADADWAALAHSVLSSHVEARLRCLNLMVFGYGFPVEQAVRLNRLRRLMEFTNDALISSLPRCEEVEQYAFDIPLVNHQQKQFRSYPVSEPIDRVRIQSLACSVDQMLSMDHGRQAANPRLNESIAEAALGILPAEFFDSFGVARSRMHPLLNHIGSDIDSSTDDPSHPLVPPFDYLIKPRRPGIEKSRRRL